MLETTKQHTINWTINGTMTCISIPNKSFLKAKVMFDRFDGPAPKIEKDLTNIVCGVSYEIGYIKIQSDGRLKFR